MEFTNLIVTILSFRLTVTDSDGVENSTTANVTVIKGKILEEDFHKRHIIISVILLLKILAISGVLPSDTEFPLGMHGYPANYPLSGEIVAFFTICICIRPETFLLSVSVSDQQNANRYRY